MHEEHVPEGRTALYSSVCIVPRVLCSGSCVPSTSYRQVYCTWTARTIYTYIKYFRYWYIAVKKTVAKNSCTIRTYIFDFQNDSKKFDDRLEDADFVHEYGASDFRWSQLRQDEELEGRVEPNLNLSRQILRLI